MTITDTISYDDLNNQLNNDETLLNLSTSAVYRLCTFIAGCVSLPAGVAMYVFNEMLIANRSTLRSILADMDDGSELQVTSTYAFNGYATDGSGIPTYKLTNQEFEIV